MYEKMKPANNACPLNIRLKNMGLRMIYTEGDGNCLLHALVKSTEYMETVERLRQELLTIVKECHSRAKEGSYVLVLPEFVMRKGRQYPIKHWDDYYKHMAKPGTWCDDTMVLAASIKFGSVISIVQSDTEYVSHHQPPPEWNITMTKSPIVIAYETDQHFSAVVPIRKRRSKRLTKKSRKALKKKLRSIIQHAVTDLHTLVKWHSTWANGIYKRILRDEVEPKYLMCYLKKKVAKLMRLTPNDTAKYLKCDARLALMLENLINDNPKYSKLNIKLFK